MRHTGAVYTPVAVAASVVEQCVSLLGTRALNVLEPSVGDGAFLPGLTGLEASSIKVTAIDVDSQVIRDLQHRYHNQADILNFIQGDFIQYAVDREIKDGELKKFDLIVGNPPFIRRHNFSTEVKESLKRFAVAFDYPLNRLKNIWPAFLLAAAKLVADDGVVALVLPYELLTVDYGQKVLNHIQREYDRVDILVSTQRAFREIDQDAVIFIAQKKPMTKPGLYISKVSDFLKLGDLDGLKIQFRNGDHVGIELNSYLLPTASVRLIKKLQSQTGRVSDFLTSAPGVVSAANDFFIRTKMDITKLGLSEYTKPILKKGSFASSSPVFTSTHFDELAERQPCLLLYLEGERERLSPAAKAYIEIGEAGDIHLRYKCRKRSNWYQVPLVEPEEAFVFKRSHSHPRVLINEAGAYTTDAAYGLRLKKGYTAQGLCFSFYTSLTMLFAEINGRFYGGGVLELSPNEFRGLALIYHEPSEQQFAEFLQVHRIANGDIHEILDFGDRWLISEGYQTVDELKVIRNSWTTIRAHRMRHGGRA